VQTLKNTRRATTACETRSAVVALSPFRASTLIDPLDEPLTDYLPSLSGGAVPSGLAAHDLHQLGTVFSRSLADPATWITATSMLASPHDDSGVRQNPHRRSGSV
jgi:hypothetical protein